MSVVIEVTYVEDRNSMRITSMRKAVRGIVLDENKILTVYSKKDNLYSVPGGGMQKGESKTDTLRRELCEETGATGIKIIKKICEVVAYRESTINPGTLFKPTGTYYLCDVQNYGKSHLDNYEKMIGLRSGFIDIDTVINHNLRVLGYNNGYRLEFFVTQTEVFKYIKKYFDL